MFLTFRSTKLCFSQKRKASNLGFFEATYGVIFLIYNFLRVLSVSYIFFL